MNEIIKGLLRLKCRRRSKIQRFQTSFSSIQFLARLSQVFKSKIFIYDRMPVSYKYIFKLFRVSIIKVFMKNKVKSYKLKLIKVNPEI